MDDAGFGLQWLPIVEAKRTFTGPKGAIDAGGAHKSALRHITIFTVTTSIVGCFSGATSLLSLYQHVWCAYHRRGSFITPTSDVHCCW